MKSCLTANASPGALYVFRTPDLQLEQELATLLVRLIQQFNIGEEFNLLKFRTDELKLSFLSYPEFFTDAHSALRKAVTIDLVTGKARRTDYTDNLNPPILHRKETFLPPDHPCPPQFPSRKTPPASVKKDSPMPLNKSELHSSPEELDPYEPAANQSENSLRTQGRFIR